MTSSRHGPLPEYGNYGTCCLLIYQETVEAAQAVSDHKFRLCDISFIAKCLIIVSLGISTKLRKFISYLYRKFCHKKSRWQAKCSWLFTESKPEGKAALKYEEFQNTGRDKHKERSTFLCNKLLIIIKHI